jgi:hypothetical protein
MNIKTSQPIPGMIVTTFDNQYDLCMSYIRIQEYYESPNPEIKGNYFSLEDFMDYWTKNFGNGVFDYASRWNGFNVPGSVFLNWRRDFWSSVLRPKENELVDAIHNEMHKSMGVDAYLSKSHAAVYIVGCQTGSKDRFEVLQHESAHAMYSLDSAYRKSADKLLKKYSRKKVYREARKALKKMGYCDEMLKDEVQAYWTAFELTGTYDGNPLDFQKEFQDNYKKHFKRLAKNGKKSDPFLKWMDKQFKKKTKKSKKV